MGKKIISSLLAFATVLSLTCFVSAYDSSMSDATACDIWAMALEKYADSTNGFKSMLLSGLSGIVGSSDIVCPTAPDNLHHGNAKSFDSFHSGRSYGVVCTCDYCGQDFTASVSSDDLTSAYNTYVSDLQTDLGTTTLINGGVRLYLIPNKAPTSDAVVDCSLGVVTSLSLNTSSGNKSIRFFYDPIYAPCAGTYSTGFSASNSSVIYDNTATYPCSAITDKAVSSGGIMYPSYAYNQSDSSPYARFLFPYLSDYWICNISVYIDFVPAPGVSSMTTQDITINSRPTSISGSFGIIGDDGNITKVDGDYIVDESTNTYHNPVTDSSSTITNWSYDYSDRSYHLNLESGENATVVFGDDNVVINEGDTTYNVYYMIPQEEQQPSDPGTDPGVDHTHTYTDEITKQPTCILSGVRTYTCSCGDSYTKTVPATGHDWQISQQVPNTYDPETGEQTQTGYTVYTCATCGEQYKSTDGTAPPNGSTGDDSSGGIGGVLSGLLGAVGDVIAGLIEGALTLATKAMEALTGLGDLLAQMIETVLGFFGGFIDFMSAMFPFLPEETFTILNLGLILMIAAAVFRKFLN